MLQQRRRPDNASASAQGSDQDASLDQGAPGRGNADASAELGRSRTRRNANDYVDGDGNTTTHGGAGAHDAVNQPSTPSPEIDDGEREVQVHHSEAAPLELEGTPAAGDIYDERPTTGECVDGWSVVQKVIGNPAAPSQIQERDDRTIFIDDRPDLADIHQGGLGDCYFLSAVTSIVNTDPDHIRDMFTLAGNQATIQMFSFDPATRQWTPRQVTVDDAFLRSTDGSGGTGDLIGAGFRMGETPTRSEWYGEVWDEELWFNQNAQFEFALWAPLLEKAHARFTERFGQYGGAHQADASTPTKDDGSAKSGYEMIDEGGWSQYCFGMLYGSNELSNSDTAINYDAEASGAELVADNLDLIENLIKVNGTDVPQDQRFFMSMSADSSTIVERLQDQLDRSLDLPDIDRYPSFKKTLGWVRALCAQHVAAEAASDDDAMEEAANKITQAATRMAAPGSWPILDSERGGGAYQDLRDLLQVAQNLGTDASDGRRSTYADHAYPVLGVELLDAQGGALGINRSDLHTRHAEIDPTASMVQFRNPHGTNEPDVDGDGADDGQDDGCFSMRLEQAIRSFSVSEQALVRT